MKINLNQLTAHLTKPLAALYIVSGDEPLLVEEAIQSIRQAAFQQGFTQRERLTTENTQWAELLYSNAHDLSLFSTKRLLEVDLTQCKFTVANTKILQEMATHLPADTLIILRMQKLDQKSLKTAWYKTLEKEGVVIPIWPIASNQWNAFAATRAKQMGLQLSPRAVELLAYSCMGNSLALVQELEKCHLLYAATPIDVNEIKALLKDQAQFDIYALVENALTGSLNASLRILNHLKAEGTEPTLILWALMQEVRLCLKLSKEQAAGTPLMTLFNQYHIWEKRQAPIQQFMRRFPQKKGWKLFLAAARTDRAIKGIESPYQGYDAIERFVFNLCYNQTDQLLG